MLFLFFKVLVLRFHMDWIFHCMLNLRLFNLANLTLLFLACCSLWQFKWRKLLLIRRNKGRFFWLAIFDVYVFSLAYGELDGSCHNIFLEMKLLIEVNQGLS